MISRWKFGFCSAFLFSIVGCSLTPYESNSAVKTPVIPVIEAAVPNTAVIGMRERERASLTTSMITPKNDFANIVPSVQHVMWTTPYLVSGKALQVVQKAPVSTSKIEQIANENVPESNVVLASNKDEISDSTTLEKLNIQYPLFCNENDIPTAPCGKVAMCGEPNAPVACDSEHYECGVYKLGEICRAKLSVGSNQK